ncbi:MAG: O-methyltransferase, partial [FCB group bacterium]|nr:O-methyltransferase [FCB group bacterium]
MLNITHPEIERYLDSLLPQRDAVFIEMEKYADKEGFPAVGPQVGALLALLVNISG